MPSIPFIGRLNLSEYVALVSSVLFLVLEAVIRILTLALPSSIINLFYRASRRLFNRLTSDAAKKSATKHKSTSTSIRDASDFIEMCAFYGYYAEQHVVQTGDGYLLGLHRLGWKRGEEYEHVNNGRNGTRKPVVYLHHGLLMNSEVWVCLTDEERCLPFTLVEKGYDVWLGNNRGNKYSKKSVHHSPVSIPFWNFSMDDFAFHDIPDSINYVLSTTGEKSLSYIGFSQGTAQAFATLAVHPRLNDQVNVFIALAPAMSPAGLSNGIVDALVKASPDLLFLMFGRRSILSSATMWQSILYPPIFVRVIDMALSFLFDWHARNMSMSQKLAAYPHLYSFTSTKSVVHWFQIIRTKSFQMYDDDVQPPLSLGSVNKFTKVAKFPTKNIKTPIVLVYGGSDSLVDIDVMLKELPQHTIATEIPHYEHLDFLWARDVDSLVFPHVFDALNSFSGASHTKEEFAQYRRARHASINATSRHMLLAASDDERASRGLISYADMARIEPAAGDGAGDEKDALPPLPVSSGFASINGARKRARLQASSDNESLDSSSPTLAGHVSTARIQPSTAFAPDGGGSDEASPSGKRRSGSIGSIISFHDGRGQGSKGIKLGAGKAAGGVVSRGVGLDAPPAGGMTSSDTDREGASRSRKSKK